MDRRNLLKVPCLLLGSLTTRSVLGAPVVGAAAVQDAGGDRPRSLDLLRYVPAEILQDLGGNPVLATVAYPAYRAAAAGVDISAGRDDEPAFADWSAAITGLLLTSSFAYALQPDWLATFGWDVVQADQTLEFGQPPDNGQVFLGRFDRDAIGAALLAGDYAEIELGGAAAAWSRAEDGEIDLSTDAGRLARGGMSNVAVMPDGALIAARTLASLTLVAETGAGGRDALADVPFVRTLLDAQAAHGSPLDSAMLLPGTALVTTIDPAVVLTASPGASLDAVADAIATQAAEQEAQGDMPPILLALAGTSGVAPALRACYTLLLPSEEAATAAVSVITDRLATGSSVQAGLPWSDVIAGWTVAAAPAAPVVLVELATDRPGLWSELVFRRDVGFLSW